MTAALTSILQTPEAFPLEHILTQNPTYMNKLIDYISLSPDPLLMNERECYSYPAKSVQILNTVGIYKLLIKKEQKKIIDATKPQTKSYQSENQYCYPYLQRIFKNLKSIPNQQILLGYVDRVLFSLAKKSPQIYEYFKDNQQSLLTILNNDRILFALKQFLTLFLTESTMMLYVFLKNMVLRTLMFRIVEDQDTAQLVYEIISDLYMQLLKSYTAANNDEDKEEIIEVLKNVEEQNFIALLVLKISPQHHRRTFFIAKILNQVAGSPTAASELVNPYIDTYTQYMQTYEQSQEFMLVIMPDQLMMLRLILRICSIEQNKLQDVKEQSIKRLLVYSNIHQKNSIVHKMLLSLVQILEQQGHKKILLKSKIIEFLKNNLKSSSSFNFKALVKRVCLFFVQKKLDEELDAQEQKLFVRRYFDERRQKMENLQFFTEAKNQSQLLLANLSIVSQKEQQKKQKAQNEVDSKKQQGSMQTQKKQQDT